MLKIQLVLLLVVPFGGTLTEEQWATSLLHYVNNSTMEMTQKKIQALWEFATNLTDSNYMKQLEASKQLENLKSYFQNVLKHLNYRKFRDPMVRRQYQIFLKRTKSTRNQKVENLSGTLIKIQSTTEICPYFTKNHTTGIQNCTLSLSNGLQNEFLNARNSPKKLKYLWSEYHKEIGVKSKLAYENYVNLMNVLAKTNGFSDTTEEWLDTFENPKIRQEIQNVIKDLVPFYQQLHAYVRFKLGQYYGLDEVPKSGLIPEYLLGNILGTNWNYIWDLIVPFPDYDHFNLTYQLLEQNYTVEKMFRESEEFFKSLNLSGMPESFWNKSIFVKPKDREIICHASAWDFLNGTDIRIKQCSKVDSKSYIRTYHEMGHLEYFLQFKNLPFLLRNAPYQGFHEAIADVIPLSIQSSTHLKKLGLLPKDFNWKMELNQLFKMAFEKVIPLPLIYITDYWRWEVFQRKIVPETYNTKWWEYKKEFQGVQGPKINSNESFDPATMDQIANGYPAIEYFISTIIQFQIHKSICTISKQYDPSDPKRALHRCDVYGSPEAGTVLKNGMRLGRSKLPSEILKVLTTQRQINAEGLLEYFKPLMVWLSAENQRNQVRIGWKY